MSKVAAIIQARIGSTRLPGKVMMNLCGKTVLAHVIERVKQSQQIDEVVIATTTNSQDDVIVDEAINNGAKVFRGSEENVLERYYLAAVENNASTIVRITSDCPLIDPKIIDEIISLYFNQDIDLATNAGPWGDQRTFPRGLDVEVFSLETLAEAYSKATLMHQIEHVTPYIYENKKVIPYKMEQDYSRHRWTLDTEDDLILINQIYARLYHGTHDFYLKDILAMFNSEPALEQINAHVKQKKA